MTAKWTDVVERDDGMDDGMDDENYHTREVYANFGLAIYHAQVLEHGVVNLLTIAKIFPDPTATREMFEPVMEQYFAQVFGKLVKEVIMPAGGGHPDRMRIGAAVRSRRRCPLVP